MLLCLVGFSGPEPVSRPGARHRSATHPTPRLQPGTSGVRCCVGTDAGHAAGVDGAPLRRDVDGLLHPVSAEGLAPAARPGATSPVVGVDLGTAGSFQRLDLHGRALAFRAHTCHAILSTRKKAASNLGAVQLTKNTSPSKASFLQHLIAVPLKQSS